VTTIALTVPVRYRWPHWQSQLPPFLGIAAVVWVLWGFIVSPMLLTVRRSIESAADGVPAIVTIWSGAFPQALVGTVVLSLLSVVTAGCTGILLAVLLHRWEFPLRRLFQALVLSPLALPPYMGAAAFAKLYGFGGILPSWLGGHVFHVDPNALAVRGIAGVLLVHTVTMYPYFYLMVSTALRQMDDSLEDAAASLGASPVQTAARVILPAMTPAVVSAALLTFMSSMGSYTAPTLFGVNNVLTRQIELAKDTNPAIADAAAVVLCLLSLVVLLAFRAYERRSSYWTASKGGARGRQRAVGRGWRAVFVAIGASVSAFMLLPTLLIVMLAFSLNGAWGEGILPSAFGLQNVTALLQDPRSWQPIVNSVEMSGLAAFAATILGVACAFLVGRTQLRGRTAIELAVMLPWALPGTVIAFNLIAALNGPSPFAFGHTLVGTWGILPLAYVVRFSPLVFRSATAALAQVDPSLEDAARSLGASRVYAVRTVTLPLLSRGIASGALLVFVSGVGEFVATTLLHTQERFKPLSVAIAQEYYSQNLGTAAAWGLVQIALVVMALVVTRRLGGRDDRLNVAAA
jgi:iron(III) transport system permease protein